MIDRNSLVLHYICPNFLICPNLLWFLFFNLICSDFELKILNFLNCVIFCCLFPGYTFLLGFFLRKKCWDNVNSLFYFYWPRVIKNYKNLWYCFFSPFAQTWKNNEIRELSPFSQLCCFYLTSLHQGGGEGGSVVSIKMSKHCR